MQTKSQTHQSALASHYDNDAKNYDAFNDKASKAVNQVIEQILKKHKVQSVLDLTCGTGSQVFWLAKRGYDVVGSDINAKMLKVAKEKARAEKLDIELIEGDMRTIRAGTFDAAITIFNAVGHLTKRDFEKAMRSIHKNLKDGGLYIFDIFNLSYLLHENNITRLTIDWQRKQGTKIIREIQYSTIDKKGILASYTTSYNQNKVTTHAQTLQIYTAQELKKMLMRNGFTVIAQCGIDGKPLLEVETERMLIVAMKQENA